ncbi:hypothetical protein D3C71_1537890 [compost metagenome]
MADNQHAPAAALIELLRDAFEQRLHGRADHRAVGIEQHRADHRAALVDPDQQRGRVVHVGAREYADGRAVAAQRAHEGVAHGVGPIQRERLAATRARDHDFTFALPARLLGHLFDHRLVAFTDAGAVRREDHFSQHHLQLALLFQHGGRQAHREIEAGRHPGRDPAQQRIAGHERGTGR